MRLNANKRKLNGRVMNAAHVAAALGDARREGRAWRCRCPLHGGHSLVLRDGDACGVLATCWGGCDRRDVLAELRRLRLLDYLRNHRPGQDRGGDDRRHLRDLDSPDNARRIARAREIWDAAVPAANTPVVCYLVSRGITMPPPATLRWAPLCWHGNARRMLPAMIALVEHVEHVGRRVVGVHRTYLRADGSGKASVEPAKASLGSIGGGAVRFGTPRKGEWFAVAEGVETLLSVTQACSIPGWAALSASGMRALILPPEATHVIICADHDASGVGQRAAHDAAVRWMSEGRLVRIATPPDPDTDFNDLLTAEVADSSGVRHVA